MNKNMAKLVDYIRLKHGGNGSEWAREYGIDPKNVSRMLKAKYYVDMTDGTLFIFAKCKIKERTE
jgi:hypothetical protein